MFLQGRNPIRCYNSLFIDGGCIKQGLMYPESLSTFLADQLHQITLKYVLLLSVAEVSSWDLRKVSQQKALKIFSAWDP